MTNKERSAEFVSNYARVFRCPVCKNPMQVANLKSLVCPKKHTFDFAKQGYVNMLTRSVKSNYDKELFEARHKIIMESDLYALLHEKIIESINENMDVSNREIVILDAGCGEGSHLQRILHECKNETMTGIGLDISKEGIRMAASKYRESIWLVGDLANSPLADQSCHVVLNILSPANYEEFKRILVRDGLIIKVVPRSHYLIELRETLFTARTVFESAETVSLFKQEFHLSDVINISYTKELNATELTNVAQMSPLAWNAKKEQVNYFTNQGFSKITVDLDILVGRNRQTKGSGE